MTHDAPFPLGTLGSVIMPHNIYLHSGLVKGKMADFDRSSDSAISVLNCYSFIDSSVALFISFLVNLAVVGTFAHFFYAPSCSASNLACVPVMDNEVSFGEICTNEAIPLGSPAVSVLMRYSPQNMTQLVYLLLLADVRRDWFRRGRRCSCLHHRPLGSHHLGRGPLGSRPGLDNVDNVCWTSGYGRVPRLAPCSLAARHCDSPCSAWPLSFHCSIHFGQCWLTQ